MKTPPQKVEEKPMTKKSKKLDPQLIPFPDRKYRIQKQSGFKIRDNTLLQTI